MTGKLEQLKIYLDPSKTWTESEESQLNLLLSFSMEQITAAMFPFGRPPPDAQQLVDERYGMLTVRAAAELYAKMGAEGQSSHSENGINRSWASAGISDALMASVIPFARLSRRSTEG